MYSWWTFPYSSKTGFKTVSRSDKTQIFSSTRTVIEHLLSTMLNCNINGRCNKIGSVLVSCSCNQSYAVALGLPPRKKCEAGLAFDSALRTKQERAKIKAFQN